MYVPFSLPHTESATGAALVPEPEVLALLLIGIPVIVRRLHHPATPYGPIRHTKSR